jgi:hypothetical protein
MTLRKLLAIGVTMSLAIVLGARRRARASQRRGAETRGVPSPGSPEDFGLASERGVAPELTGISDVDPVPLTQLSAEAIDRDATEEAHQQILRQRERLPVPGKNLP